MNPQENTYQKFAENAGLVYVHDFFPGITRQKRGKGYSYFFADGRQVKDKVILSRIKSLGIPPAYERVWICPFENGHIQATGYDKKCRKQYRYHPKWRQFRQEINYQRMIDFGHALPGIRRAVGKDLNTEGLTKKRVLATIVRIMDMTLIRVGNEKYAKENNSYGLTTIQKDHVYIEDKRSGVFKFEFVGKSRKQHDIKIRNKKLFHIIQNCLELPGYPLFQFEDEKGVVHDITSDDVNDYLKCLSGSKFTAKDFRTWWGTVFTLIALEKVGVVSSQKEVKKALSKAVKFTSEKLRNTPTVCRKFYVYPGILESFEEGKLSGIIEEFKQEKPIHGLSHEEWWTLQFLEKKALKG